MTSDSRSTLAGEILEATGVNAAACYQCGKCSAGCPMASESALRPHTVMRLVMQDRREEALADESIWLCLTCETCSARCPNACDPARVIDAVRELSVEAGAADMPRTISAFHKAFLEQIRSNGRLHEFGMVVEYKLRSGDLMKDVTSAPGMLSRGKLSFRAERIEGVDEIKRIFAKCRVTL
ncbi:MAG TPA: 4Fe-4S dicluster domain-containing protein [Thermoleophilia bacterium]